MKFILLGHPRSGSTLVTVTLQAHPDIRMFGEVFHAEFQNRFIAYQWGIECRPSSQMYPSRTSAWCYTQHQDGARFLEDLVFGDSSEDGPSAVGFKFFYDHAREPPASSAWDYLRRHDEIRVIDLVRENFLDCLLSSMTAERTSVWEVEDDDPLPVEPELTIDPADCEKYFNRLTRLRREAEAKLFAKERQVLRIDYEPDILETFDATVCRIQAFLGVESLRVTQRLRKQSRLPPAARITNYRQLDEYFDSTPFHAFFR